MFRPWTLVLSVFILAAEAADKKPVTLEALSHPGASDSGGLPVWAPDGRRFAFQKQSKIFLYDIASKSSKELLSTEDLEKSAMAAPAAMQMPWENRRVGERPIQWSPDGKNLLLASNGDLFLWSEASAKTEQLTKTEVAERDAKLSPDGTKVSFRREHDLYVMEIASRKVTRLTTDGSATLWNGMLDWVYPEELDLGTAHWWSPDSKSIAYLQFDVSRETMYPHIDPLPIDAVAEPQRYPKAGTPNADVRVGVVSASGGRTRWMDYGETRDHLIARVCWSPTSRDVVAHRMNRVQNRLEIRAADVESGASRVLLRESDPYWINVNDDFHFLSSGGFVLTSERDEYRHIYRYDNTGKLEAQLTQGPWEVSYIAGVDEAGNKVYYVGTEVSPLERQLYVTGLDGAAKKQLTQGAGTHTVSMSPAYDYYLDTFTSPESPSRRTLHKATDGSEWAVYQEADRKAQDEFDLLKPEFLNFKSADGTTFYARLVKPAGFDPAKKYPAIVIVYGGPQIQTVRSGFADLGWDQVLAHKGFVIWQMDSRGSAGRGHQWESKLYRRLGKQELDDQKEGVAHLVSLGFVDPKRIGIYGWSYGGFMTLYSLLHAPEVFAAGIAGAAVTDWRNYDTIYTERYLGLPQENPEGYEASSPVNAAADLKGKLLLIHNLEDDNVLFANALQMTNALQKAGRTFEFMLYPQKSHGVTGKARMHMMETATEFFVDALKPEGGLRD
jgi:dipeptidyl-peptidase 4